MQLGWRLEPGLNPNLPAACCCQQRLWQQLDFHVGCMACRGEQQAAAAGMAAPGRGERQLTIRALQQLPREVAAGRSAGQVQVVVGLHR